ncbi:MAG: flagellar hook-length control protein FliK [Planctomycetes bacterium]|nr:flagellar hook-length control protein FliK [Planctomycetota bacterium]
MKAAFLLTPLVSDPPARTSPRASDSHGPPERGFEEVLSHVDEQPSPREEKQEAESRREEEPSPATDRAERPQAREARPIARRRSRETREGEPQKSHAAPHAAPAEGATAATPMVPDPPVATESAAQPTAPLAAPLPTTPVVPSESPKATEFGASVEAPSNTSQKSAEKAPSQKTAPKVPNEPERGTGPEILTTRAPERTKRPVEAGIDPAERRAAFEKITIVDETAADAPAPSAEPAAIVRPAVETAQTSAEDASAQDQPNASEENTEETPNFSPPPETKEHTNLAPQRPNASGKGVPIGPPQPQAEGTHTTTATAPAAAAPAAAEGASRSALPTAGPMAAPMPAAGETRPTAAPAEPAAPPPRVPEIPRWMDDPVVKQIGIHLRPGMSEMTVRLDPPGLGEVRIQFLLKDRRLHARVRATSESTSAMLKDRSSELEAALRGAGIDVGSLDIGGGRGRSRAHANMPDIAMPRIANESPEDSARDSSPRPRAVRSSTALDLVV